MNDNDTQSYPVIDQPMYIVATYGIAYGLIFLCAIVGNVMVLVVVATTPCMHTVTNFFIANLAVADLLVAVLCIPLTFLDNIVTGWPFGEFMCKVTPYVQGVSVNATAYLLVAIAVDRFLAICFSYTMRIMKRSALVIICIIWIVSFLLMTPWVVYYQTYPNTQSQPVTMCSDLWPDYDSQRSFYVVVLFLANYLIPLTAISICYVLIAWRVCHRRAPGVVVGSDVIRRCKINVIKMLATVVLMFALSWLPVHIIYMRFYFFSSIKDNDISVMFIPIAQWLGLSNSGINAFIYSFFSQNFRRGFYRLWSCLKFKRKPQRGSMSDRRVTRTVSDESSSLARYSTLTRSKTTDVTANGYTRRDHLGRPLNLLKSRQNVSFSSSGSSSREQTFV